MKKNILAAGILIYLFAGCFKKNDATSSNAPKCNEIKEEEFKNVNVFDFTPGSAYYNTAVSVFKVKKERISRTGDCSGLSISECKNFLSIQNTTNKKVTYSFILEYALNFYYWQYQNTVTIQPNATVDLGLINNNCGSLPLGTVVVRLSVITYQ